MPFIKGIGVARAATLADKGFTEMIFEATSQALDDAGLTRAEIDGVSLAASDQLDGRAISSMQAAGPAGGFLRDEVKVSDDGSLALATAVLRIEAGVSRHVVVASWTKSSESPPDAALGVNPEPVFTRSIGLHPRAAEAAVTATYVQEVGLDLAAVDELAGSLNGGRTDGSMIAYPLKEHHIPPLSDAAFALVVSEDRSPIEVAALSWGTDHPDPTRRANRPDVAVGNVVERVCQQAGVRITPELPVETTDHTVFRLCMAATGLGLAGASSAPNALMRGELSNVNRSGGLWASNPIFAAGLERVVEAVRHVRLGAESVLVHASYGFAGQGQFATVLRRS